ncbi:MAG: glucosamine-6-phosphate deaminase, partial [Flavisolibacter sp.]
MEALTSIKKRKRTAIDLTDAYERIPLKMTVDLKEGSLWVAHQIADLIREKQAQGKTCVLGLATGSTPKYIYAEMVRMHREEGLSFHNVISFNLDEYYPMEKGAWESYHSFMHRHLFDHVNLEPKNIHIPNGELPKEGIKAHCLTYEQIIEESGGIDLQLLGIGNNGHIGFNEPGSSIHSRTRLVSLENSTRLANAYEFVNISEVPRMALTAGISTILKAKRIILCAWGPGKAPVIQKALEGHVTEQVPASLLQQHNDCLFVVDEAAAAELTRFKSPWLTGEIQWTPPMVKKAVVNMALKLNKAVLSLTN